MIDALAVYKDAAGEVEVEDLSNLSTEEAIELGSKIGALIGLGIEGEEGAEAGAAAGAEATAEGVQVFSDEQAWDVLEEIPNDSAAALVLLEHHWAGLRDAVVRAGGFRISDGFISPRPRRDWVAQHRGGARPPRARDHLGGESIGQVAGLRSQREERKLGQTRRRRP